MLTAGYVPEVANSPTEFAAPLRGVGMAFNEMVFNEMVFNEQLGCCQILQRQPDADRDARRRPSATFRAFDQPSSVPAADLRMMGAAQRLHAHHTSSPTGVRNTLDVAVSERRLRESGDSVRGAQLSTCRRGAFRCRSALMMWSSLHCRHSKTQ
jgi:hypothetical protein